MGPVALTAMTVAAFCLVVVIVVYWRYLRWEKRGIGRHMMAATVAALSVTAAEIAHAVAPLPVLVTETLLALAYCHLVFIAIWRLRLILAAAFPGSKET